MPTVVLVDQLLGNAELGRLLGVSRQRVSQLAASAGFPAPRAALAMGSIWALPDVISWAQRQGRTLHLDTLTDTTLVQANPGPEPQSKREP